MTTAEQRFRAMGSDAHVVITGDGADEQLARAAARIDALERRWSRFLEASELSRLNAAGGRPTIVSADTMLLVRRALDAWWLTGGAFDPTVAGSVRALGYTVSFDAIATAPAPPVEPARAAPGPAGITIDAVVGALTLPPGVQLDAGGIGKGLAGDVVVAEALAAGAAGALVNLGGDVRVAGEPPTEAGWVVGIEWPGDLAAPGDPGRALAHVRLEDGALCTSSTRRRSWTRADGSRVHHLVDPASGDPFGGELVQVSVTAGEGWWAEALTKALFAGRRDELVNASALMVHAAGTVEVLGLPHVFEGLPPRAGGLAPG